LDGLLLGEKQNFEEHWRRADKRGHGHAWTSVRLDGLLLEEKQNLEEH
jgi:hypothetical protein